jgi:PAS domain S-box-containing protein
MLSRPVRGRGRRLPPSVRALLPYVWAVLLVAAATLSTVYVKPLQEKTSIILYFAAVVGSSYLGGMGPALFAVLLSCFARMMFLIPPAHSLAIKSPSDTVRLVLFVLVAVLASWLYEQLARARRDLARQRARLDLALEAARMGVWDYDLMRDEFSISPQLHEIFGSREDEVSPTYGGFLAFIHPDDRPAVVRAMTTAGESGGGYQLEHRIVRRDNNAVRWIATRGRTISDDHGRAERMIGLVIDVTDRRTDHRRDDTAAAAAAQPNIAAAARFMSS